MGKKAKEHRKKVQARNARIKAEQNRMKKMYTDMFNKQMEEMQSKLSEELKVESGGLEIPFEVMNNSDAPQLTVEEPTVEEPMVEDQVSELEK